MKLTFRWIGISVVSTLLSVSLLGQTAAAVKKKPRKTGPAVASQQDLQALRGLVQAQHDQIEAQSQQVQQLQGQLQQVLDAVQQSNANAQKLQGSSEQAQATAAQAEQSALEAQQTASQASSAAASAASVAGSFQTRTKDEEAQLKNIQTLVGRFRLSGDIRVRGENYTQSGTLDRNRARVRVRLG